MSCSPASSGGTLVALRGQQNTYNSEAPFSQFRRISPVPLSGLNSGISICEHDNHVRDFGGMDADNVPTSKKQRSCGSESGGALGTKDGGEVDGGLGPLPSKEAMASKGLEAKVDMATHGLQSWAMTSLGSWRYQSLGSSGLEGGSAEFIKSRQREARRAMLGASTKDPLATAVGEAESKAANEAGDIVAESTAPETVPAKPPGEETATDMAVG